MTSQGWGRRSQPHFGVGARPLGKDANAVGEGRGRCSGIRNRYSLHAPYSRMAPRRCRKDPRISVPLPPKNPRWRPALATARPYLRPQVYALDPQISVGRGREGGPLLPPALVLPSPGRLRSRRRRCPLLQCESRRRCRAGPGPGRPGNGDSTWRGAPPCSSSLQPPPPARPRRRSPGEERRRLVAASPRSPDTPARRPGLGLQGGGKLDRLVEAGEGLRLGV